MDREALERARMRLTGADENRPRAADVEAALAQAKDGLEALAQTAAELEAGIPEQLGSALQEGLRAEVLPVARHIAEVRGLSAQTIRRLERRLDRLERIMDRVERALEDRPVATVYRIDDRQERRMPGA